MQLTAPLQRGRTRRAESRVSASLSRSQTRQQARKPRIYLQSRRMTIISMATARPRASTRGLKQTPWLTSSTPRRAQALRRAIWPRTPASANSCSASTTSSRSASCWPALLAYVAGTIPAVTELVFGTPLYLRRPVGPDGSAARLDVLHEESVAAGDGHHVLGHRRADGPGPRRLGADG